MPILRAEWVFLFLRSVMIQDVIVIITISLAAFYLGRIIFKSIKSKKSGHCSGCGKE
ncbi:MAG: FeoB-associated Cys-rich membrane protein [Candidatus Omnitrophica bacterium]|nr:FeoB-associated Cys-rich membrane protein [Candidatus Omnitrophota bacterium]